MLDLNNIDLVYNAGSPTEVTALSGLDVSFERGQFTTVVGTNGAGKSSMIQIVSGSARPTRGRVVVDGRDITSQPDYRRAGRIARVFDNPHAGTLPELSIADNVALAMSRGRRRTLRFALSDQRKRIMRERLSHLRLGLEDRLSDPVSLLSAGQRQSLTMVMAGLCDPEVLLLDEHLAALDPGTQARVLGLTKQLVGEFGCTTLMVTHNMEHAISIGDRLIVMSRGRKIADFSGAEKAGLTVEDLIARITGAGDAVSDRLVLTESARGSFA